MLIYARDKSRIFIGSRDKIFPLSVGSLIQQCLMGDDASNTENTIDTKSVLNEQFLPLRKQSTNDAENLIKNKSTKTPANEARPSSIAKVTDHKKASKGKKHFDSIIANTTEIDEFEGSGQEVKADDEIVKLISSVSSHSKNQTKQENQSVNCKFDIVFIANNGKDLPIQLNLSSKIVERIPDALIPADIRIKFILIKKVSQINQI
jgi:hypothetical protein